MSSFLLSHSSGFPWAAAIVWNWGVVGDGDDLQTPHNQTLDGSLEEQDSRWHSVINTLNSREGKKLWEQFGPLSKNQPVQWFYFVMIL